MAMATATVLVETNMPLLMLTLAIFPVIPASLIVMVVHQFCKMFTHPTLDKILMTKATLMVTVTVMVTWSIREYPYLP